MNQAINPKGANFLNSLIEQGRYVSVAVLGSELKEIIETFIWEETGVKLPFEVCSTVSGQFFMEIDFESLSDEDYIELGETYACPQEMFLFADVIVERLFGSNAVIYLSEDAEDELLSDSDLAVSTLCFSISLQPMKACFMESNSSSFAQTSWCREDVAVAIADLGEEPTDELIEKVLKTPRFEKMLVNTMVCYGWNCIKDVVSDCLTETKE